MVLRRLPLVGAALACGLLLVAGAAAREAVPDKDPHPQDRDLEHRRAAVPCDQALATIELVPGLDWSVADTTAGEGVVPSYACQNWDESGPEHVYLLEVAEELIVDIWLAGNEPADLDLALLSACDSDSCLVQTNTELSAQLPPGSYVLVVDGYQGAAGPYELSLAARVVGIPPEVCEAGGAQDLGDFAGGGSPAAYTATLFEQPNLVSVYDCSPIAVRGGERWYALTLAAADTTYDDDTDIGSVRIQLTATPGSNAGALDLACWLFDGCGPEAACLAFADENPAGGAEELRWINQETSARTVYLAVDCVQAPVNESGGEFDLEAAGTVTVKARSLGDVKRLFR